MADANTAEIQYIDGVKTLVPLENNPEVMSHLIHELGVSPKLGFYDIYSIDDPDLLAFIPRPVYGLIFICPHDVYVRTRESMGTDNMPEYTGSGPDEPVMWFRQTIKNTCGLMALIHCISNGEAREYIPAGSELDKLFKTAVDLAPTERAQLLYDSTLLERAHRSAARRGDSAVPAPDDKCGFHYICFVRGSDGHLWDLEGGVKGPIDRGLLDEGQDGLSEKALELGVRAFLKHQNDAGKGVDASGFSIVALAPSMD
ncbi:putative ubiquitinyl hydrolase 1 [Microsporum canis]